MRLELAAVAIYAEGAVFNVLGNGDKELWMILCN